MTTLIPLTRRHNLRPAGFEDFFGLFDNFFTDSFSRSPLSRDSFRLDVEENDAEYRVQAELPGVNKDEIDLNAEDETLSISVNRSENAENEGRNYLHRERRAVSMSRSVRLRGADLDGISAKLDNGVLTVTVPKAAGFGPRKINIA